MRLALLLLIFACFLLPSMAITVSMIYPANGSTFFGSTQCSFLGQANITFENGSVNRSIVASLYLDNIFQSSKTLTPVGNGTYNANFTKLTQGGIYNVSFTASDSNGTANDSAWGTLGAMGACLTAVMDTDSNAWAFLSFVLIGLSLVIMPNPYGAEHGAGQ